MLHVIKSNESSAPRARRFSISCVVPVYNEAAGIGLFLQALEKSLLKLTSEVDIIVVNDGSTDESADKILDAPLTARLRYLEFSRNFGKEIAIQAGLDAASGDCTLILDADFQHPVELIAVMVERWRAGIDMVYAAKRDRNAEGWPTRMAALLFERLMNERRTPKIPRNGGDFRLLDRKVVAALRALPERDRYMKGLYSWVGFKSEAIPFVPPPRTHGVSKYSALSLLSLAATGITSFSNVPLRWVSATGVLVSLGSLLMAGWLIIEKLLLGQPIAGFATISASIFLFAGVQLMALGIVGEYVGRIFEEVKQRPRYLLARDVQLVKADSSLSISQGSA